MITKIQEILRPFGITRKYAGCQQLALAVQIIQNDPDSLEAVGKQIYRPIASQCHCEWKSVERNVRTLAMRAWDVNPQYLQQIAGYPLSASPTAAEFMEIISNYIQRSTPPQPCPVRTCPTLERRFSLL